MNLTAKQLRFCQEIANGKTQHDAYCSAYNTGKMKNSTIDTKAWELLQNGKDR